MSLRTLQPGQVSQSWNENQREKTHQATSDSCYLEQGHLHFTMLARSMKTSLAFTKRTEFASAKHLSYLLP
jgi:hypothetical protein